jgi:hypothetical protein
MTGARWSTAYGQPRRRAIRHVVSSRRRSARVCQATRRRGSAVRTSDVIGSQHHTPSHRSARNSHLTDRPHGSSRLAHPPRGYTSDAAPAAGKLRWPRESERRWGLQGRTRPSDCPVRAQSCSTGRSAAHSVRTGLESGAARREPQVTATPAIKPRATGFLPRSEVRVLPGASASRGRQEASHGCMQRPTVSSAGSRAAHTARACEPRRSADADTGSSA